LKQSTSVLVDENEIREGIEDLLDNCNCSLTCEDICNTCTGSEEERNACIAECEEKLNEYIVESSCELCDNYLTIMADQIEDEHIRSTVMTMPVALDVCWENEFLPGIPILDRSGVEYLWIPVEDHFSGAFSV